MQNQVRDFNGLARKPLCYRYTIPQNLSIINKLLKFPATCLERINDPAKREPFYSFSRGLGKHETIQLGYSDREDWIDLTFGVAVGASTRRCRRNRRSDWRRLERELRLQTTAIDPRPFDGAGRAQTCPCQTGMQC